MQRVVLAPSNRALLKPLRVVCASHVLEEVIRRFQVLSEGQCLDDQIGIFGTAARFSYLLDEETVYWCVEWNLNALRIEANWYALGRWNDAADFCVGATRGGVGRFV